MVTGAGKNIGKEIALNFAAEGANVVVCDYNKENAEETVSEIKKLGVDVKLRGKGAAAGSTFSCV